MTNTNQQLYTNCLVYVGGKLLAEAVSLTLDRVTNAQNVITIAKGFAGKSPGAPMANFSVESAVPSAEFELDPASFMGDQLKTAQITYFAAGKTCTMDAWIDEDNFSYAANAVSKLTFKGVSGFPTWS